MNTQRDRELLRWVHEETARRSREENPERPARLRPLEDFSDEYADPTRYKTVDQERGGTKLGNHPGTDHRRLLRLAEATDER